MEDFYSSIESPLHRNLQSGRTYQAWNVFLWKDGWERQKKTRRSFLFFLLRKLIIPQAPLCLKSTPTLSSKLLHFFCSRLTSPQAHTVWVTSSSFSSTIAPPPFSHWLFYVLLPSLRFLLFLFIADYSHQPAHSQRAPRSLPRRSRFKPQLSPWKETEITRGILCSSLKVQLFFSFSVYCIFPFHMSLDECLPFDQ